MSDYDEYNKIYKNTVEYYINIHFKKIMTQRLIWQIHYFICINQYVCVSIKEDTCVISK